MFAPALALAVVLGTAAAGSGDYVLVMPEHGIGIGSCAKSAETCEAAREAVRRGYIVGVPPETPTDCRPHPDCFSTRSNVIPGFNDR